MAARTEPAEPVFTTESEAMVWCHVVASLGPRTWCWPTCG